MRRSGEDVGDAAGFDDLSALHDADAVGIAADDLQIMGDQQQGEAALGLEARQKLQDLRLDGDIERGGRLVGDQQRGVVGQRRGDHDPLALAAGQLVRKCIQAMLCVGEAGLGQQLDDAVAQRGA